MSNKVYTVGMHVMKNEEVVFGSVLKEFNNFKDAKEYLKEFCRLNKVGDFESWERQLDKNYDEWNDEAWEGLLSHMFTLPDDYNVYWIGIRLIAHYEEANEEEEENEEV